MARWATLGVVILDLVSFNITSEINCKVGQYFASTSLPRIDWLRFGGLGLFPLGEHPFLSRGR
jgi:hypothetical protein